MCRFICSQGFTRTSLQIAGETPHFLFVQTRPQEVPGKENKQTMKKRLLLYWFIASAAVVGCSKYDDTKLWNSLDGLTTRVERLEQQCDKMNENIVALQIIVQSLQTNDGIKTLTTLPNGEGYTITFLSGKTITIYNGKDGKNGLDGTNGKDGKDGANSNTPEISVKKDTDGIYYWTVNGDWLIADGAKVRAAADNGKDGKDGVDGANGITPQFKIEDGYWFISYDGKENWEKLGKATGENGLNGKNGESIFKYVSVNAGYVQFTLNDETETTIRLPFATDTALTVTVKNAGTLRELLTAEQKSTVSHLIVKGEINEEDIKYINLMSVLNYLDLSEAELKGYCKLNPFGKDLLNRTFRTVIWPRDCTNYSGIDFAYCLNLEKLVVLKDSSFIRPNVIMGPVDNEGCMNYSVDTLIFSEGITTIGDTYSDGTKKEGSTLTRFRVNILPSTLEFVGTEILSQYYVKLKHTTIICKAQIPPKPYLKGFKPTSFYDYYNDWNTFTLYVPEQSVEAYRTADGWKAFPNILPIEGNINPEDIFTNY